MSQSENPVPLILFLIVNTYRAYRGFSFMSLSKQKVRFTYAALVAQFMNIQKYPTLSWRTIPLTLESPAIAPAVEAGSLAVSALLISAHAAMTEDIT